jgi:hypothetical protein
MKKTIIVLLIIFCMTFALSACGTNDSSQTAKEPANLTGEWKQVNSNSGDSWQAATIEGETITIYWVSDNGDTKSLYWAGTYVAPTTSEEPYTWDSVNDHEQTDMALFASGDDTKAMTYENGQISYSASALGTTMTIRLEKQN